MTVHRMEDYRIRLRLGRAEPTGTYELTRRGTKRPISKFMTTYQTDAGDIKQSEWIGIAKELIHTAGSDELLEVIKEYCSKHCAWLHTKEDIEEHSVECLLSRAYRHWEEFSTMGAAEPTAFVFDFSKEEMV